jgi:hypothetical protein
VFCWISYELSLQINALVKTLNRFELKLLECKIDSLETALNTNIQRSLSTSSFLILRKLSLKNKQYLMFEFF